MRSSLPRLRDGYPRVPVDAADAPEGLKALGSPRSTDDPPYPSTDRRVSFRHSQCASPSPSVISRVNSFDSLAEIEKHTAEIESLIGSDDELKEFASSFGTKLQEKEETASESTRRMQRIKTRGTFFSPGSRTTSGNITDLETEDIQDNAAIMSTILQNNMELERARSWVSQRAQYESEIKKLRKQLEIEHGISANLKLKLREKQNMNELSKKELHDLKVEKNKIAAEMIELQKELDREVSKTEQLEEELNKRRNTDDMDKLLESMKVAVEVVRKENLELKVKEEMLKSLPHLEKDADTINELASLLKHFLDKELEKSNEDVEYSKIINGLQLKCESQTAEISKLVDAVKEDVSKQEELKTVTSIEFQRTHESLNGLDQKLAECMDLVKMKADELVKFQAALSQLNVEREAKEILKKDVCFAREELAKQSDLLKTTTADLELSREENKELAHKLSHTEKMLLESMNKFQNLEEDNSKLHRALEHSMKRINNMATDSENYVDRRIVVKLLVTYFQRNNSKEVLDLMVRLLNFSEEDKRKVGFVQQASMTGVHNIINITGRLVGSMLGSKSVELSSKELRQGQSMADLWVDFLLKDADQREKRNATEACNTQGDSPLTMTSPDKTESAERNEELATTPLLPSASSTIDSKSSFLDCF